MIEKTKRMRRFNHANAGSALLFDDHIPESLHLGPMHFGSEMMFSMITVVEPSPVVQLVVTAYSPRDRFVRISAVMPVVPIQVRETVPKVIERNQETDVVPIQNPQRNERSDKKRKLRHSQDTLRADSAASIP